MRPKSNTGKIKFSPSGALEDMGRHSLVMDPMCNNSKQQQSTLLKLVNLSSILQLIVVLNFGQEFWGTMRPIQLYRPRLLSRVKILAFKLSLYKSETVILKFYRAWRHLTWGLSLVFSEWITVCWHCTMLGFQGERCWWGTFRLLKTEKWADFRTSQR